MAKQQDDLFLSVLKTLHSHGALKEMVLIGSWCQLFYKDMFKQGAFVPRIRTKDMDMLILRPRNVSTTVDVTGLLNNLGFETHFSRTTGYMKYIHEDFTVEFLMPLRGSGIKGVEYVKPLSLTVQGLRYLDFSRDEIMTARYGGCEIRLPRPEAFALLKFLVQEERANPEKQAKDLSSAQELGTLLVSETEHCERLKKSFSRHAKKIQKRLLRITKEHAPDVYEVLSSVQ